MCYDASDYTWGIVVPGQSVTLISFKLVLLSKLCNLGNIHPIFSFLLCKVYYKCSIGQHQHHIWAGGGREAWGLGLAFQPGLVGCSAAAWTRAVWWSLPHLMGLWVDCPSGGIGVWTWEYSVCMGSVSVCVLHSSLSVSMLGKCESVYMCAWGWACMLVCACFPY